MPQPPAISTAPFVHQGGDLGLLVLHGFTGSTAETRPLGEALARRGHSVRCPLLPRHGTRVEELTRGDYEEWLAEARLGLRLLAERCARVFVVGMSLGSLIALRLVEEDRRARGAVVSGLVALSPPLVVRSRLLPLAWFARHVIAYDLGRKVDDAVDRTLVERNWCYDKTPLWGAAEVWRLLRAVRRDLSLVDAPLLVMQGRCDRVLRATSAQALLDRVSSRDRELVWLERSGHNVLLDAEREQVWHKVASWVEERARDPSS